MNSIIATVSRITALTTLLAAVACGSGAEDTGKSQSSAASGACPDDEEGAADKVTCTVDADCDSDEVCTAGLCAGLDGDTETEDDCDVDDEGGADKINCTVDADCDSDEVCSSGKCE